jgi:hypothetical protein
MRKTFGQIISSLVSKMLGFKQKADEQKAEEESEE